MCKRIRLSVIVAAIVLVSLIAAPASGQSSILSGFTAASAAPEQPSEPLIDAMPDDDDAGIIAYVKSSTCDIHLISPDGSGDRVLWTHPELFVEPAHELAWRPDGRELAFSSGHEQGCSWYESDVYAIGANGAGYRRVTNSPACAVLAGLPQGAVTVNVNNYTSTPIWVYVQGAPEIKYVDYSGTVTFEQVADLGPGVYQPSIGIHGLTRFTSYPPYADVQPGETRSGGNITIMSLSGFSGFGGGKVSWKADGSALAYGMRSASGISQIPASPPYGSTGVALPVVEKASPSLVAWGPTPATKDQYLYSSGMDVLKDNVGGIYLNTVGDASGGTQLVLIPDYSGQIAHDIEWLPDGSGFLFTLDFTQFPPDPPGLYSDIFEYNFASQAITRLTSLRYDSVEGGAQVLSISPDGQQIVFERALFDPLNPSPSLWIMNRDGSNLHKLIDDAGRPAWGPTPAAGKYRGYLPLVLKGGAPVPAVPVLNPIDNADGDGNYTVSWNASAAATGYTLQEDDAAAFPSPETRYAGSGTSWNAAGKAADTYYYRVEASNASGPSGWSGTQSVTVGAPPIGWTILVSTDFEGAWPGPWRAVDNDGAANGEYYWGKRNCRAYAGSYSGWGAGAGAQGSTLGCTANYPDSAASWMVYGPFSLEDVTAAELTFKLWLNSELNYDRVCRLASTNGTSFEGYCVSGNTDGWVDQVLDLADVGTSGDLLGQPKVWVALVFSSDAGTNYAEGGYVDNIVLRKCPTGGTCPAGSAPMRRGEDRISEYLVRGVDLTGF
jgi:TolB protein